MYGRASRDLTFDSRILCLLVIIFDANIFKSQKVQFASLIAVHFSK